MATRKPGASLTVNAAFLQEIKEVNEELWKLLARVRGMCHSVSEVRLHPGRLPGKLAELRDQMAMHFALEEAYGYFEDPVVEAPRLSTLAEPLRAEHSTLYSQLGALVELVEAEHFRGRLGDAAPRVVEAFRRFDQRLQIHETKENELIQEAFGNDIGVGD